MLRFKDFSDLSRLSGSVKGSYRDDKGGNEARLLDLSPVPSLIAFLLSIRNPFVLKAVQKIDQFASGVLFL